MRRFLIVFLLFFYGYACAQPASLLHKPYAERHYFLDSVWKSFDTVSAAQATVVLKGMQRAARANMDMELAAELVLMEIKRAPDKLANEGAELKIADITLLAKDEHNGYLEADALQALGDYLRDKKKYGPAFENYLLAYNIYKRFSADEFPPKQEYLYILGSAYYQYDDIDNAAKYMKEALQINTSDRRYENTLLNTMGMCYRKVKRYDSSDWYFRKVYNLAVAGNDSAWIGIAEGNIGINYYLQKRYEEAAPLLEKDIDMSLATRSIKNAASSMNILAGIYYVKKDYNKAEQLLKRALALCENKSFWPDYVLAEQIYTLLYKVYAAKNDLKNAYVYADSAVMVKDSVSVRFNALTIAKAKEKTDFAQHKLEGEKLANQKKIQGLIRNGLLLTIIMLTIIAILAINRQRLIQKRLLAEKKTAEQELDNAVLQLNTFRQSVQEKNSLIEQFTNELDKIKAITNAPPDEEILSQLERSVILTDEQWEHFRELFEKVHKGFFTNLRMKMPDLTPAEVRFVALSKLKLSAKEMSAILGISANSIRNYRHRLRKKLELDDDTSFEEIADTI